MKISLSKEDLNKVNNLINIKEENINVSEMYLYYLENESREINANIIKMFNQGNEERAFYDAFLKIMDLDPDDEELKIIEENHHIDKIKCLDENKYLSNPYYKNIKVPSIKEKNWYFKYDTFAPYEGFMYKDLEVNEENNFEEISSLGYFKKPFKYLTITQNNDIWMSITPHEIETMESSIKGANGNVVVYGLGLGYYPYMISLKEGVKEITIVEIDQNVINLFNEYLLPQFTYKNKIKVIKANALDYAKKAPVFDYAFVDLWHNVDDGISLYLKMKKLESKNTIYSYWIESSLLTMIRRLLLVLIEEEINGSKENNYLKIKNYEDFIISRLYYILKDYQVNSYNDIKELLKKDSLLKIVKQIEN